MNKWMNSSDNKKKELRNYMLPGTISGMQGHNFNKSQMQNGSWLANYKQGMCRGKELTDAQTGSIRNISGTAADVDQLW